jgi:succinyl-CoA synthetase alpha subunit
MPAQVFRRGPVGIVSRSGTLFYEIAAHITRIGLGQSMCVGLGGDPVVGLDFIDVLRWFAEDDETEAVALIGEIGGDARREPLSLSLMEASQNPSPLTSPDGWRYAGRGWATLGR